LARHIKFSEAESPLRKNGRLVVPNVPHIFSFEKPTCFLYFEAYNLAPVSSHEGAFQVQCQISRMGKGVRAGGWTIPKSETKVAVSFPLDLKDLEPGEYLLTVTVVDQDGKHRASAGAMFYITRSIV
jgi:hypothetical protein